MDILIPAYNHFEKDGATNNTFSDNLLRRSSLREENHGSAMHNCYNSI